MATAGTELADNRRVAEGLVTGEAQRRARRRAASDRAERRRERELLHLKKLQQRLPRQLKKTQRWLRDRDSSYRHCVMIWVATGVTPADQDGDMYDVSYSPAPQMSWRIARSGDSQLIVRILKQESGLVVRRSSYVVNGNALDIYDAKPDDVYWRPISIDVFVREVAGDEPSRQIAVYECLQRGLFQLRHPHLATLAGR